jgi:hypothetical protein
MRDVEYASSAELSSSDRGHGESGDPLLKRLVDLAQLGWQPELVIFSNGAWLRGRLVSPKTFRAALAESIRVGGDADSSFAALDVMVASAIEREDPGPSGLGAPSDLPEPRFIHMAAVREATNGREIAPFIRLRLPAVSAFWLVGRDDEAG